MKDSFEHKLESMLAEIPPISIINCSPEIFAGIVNNMPVYILKNILNALQFMADNKRMNPTHMQNYVIAKDAIIHKENFEYFRFKKHLHLHTTYFISKN